jgi:hypothetical protein
MEILTSHEQVIILSLVEKMKVASFFYIPLSKFLSQEMKWNSGWRCHRNYNVKRNLKYPLRFRYISVIKNGEVFWD